MLMDPPAKLIGAQQHSLTQAVRDVVAELNRLRRDARLEPDERTALNSATQQAALAAAMVGARKR